MAKRKVKRVIEVEKEVEEIENIKARNPGESKEERAQRKGSFDQKDKLMKG